MSKHRSHDGPDPGAGPDPVPGPAVSDPAGSAPVSPGEDAHGHLGRNTSARDTAPGRGPASGTAAGHGAHTAATADGTPDIDFEGVQRDDRFRELRRSHRSFVFPMAAAFLLWYFLYVLLADYAHDFMSTRLVGNITVGIVLGLAQFVTTFAITMAYVSYANRRLDPQAADLRDELEGVGSPYHLTSATGGDTFDGDVDALARRDSRRPDGTGRTEGADS